MTNLDQFESVFKSAVKPVFHFQPLQLKSVLVVTDLPEEQVSRFAGAVRSFLKTTERDSPPKWRTAGSAEFSTVGDLLDLVRTSDADLICTYRNLHSGAWRWPHSLGSHVDVLTQATDVPVLLLPNPQAQPAEGSIPHDTHNVMAITDHLAGDERLVSAAASLTFKGGRLLLTHVEEQRVYDRYLEVISKLPEIDTDVAREAILQQLLKEPRDYISSCRTVLQEQQLPIEVEEVVAMGDHLADYRRLIQERQVQLLVLNTKDDDQLAMHGLAYSLAVELRSVPLLLL